ncbi:MAG TPA: fibronectin type III domain-containing protein [Spirochaetota bacterium]|nr:fibronectin type III domain-containing protein [Spirochaetota bacterium]
MKKITGFFFRISIVIISALTVLYFSCKPKQRQLPLFTGPAAGNPPAAPTGITVSGTPGESSAVIIWSNNTTNETRFNIYWNTTDTIPALPNATVPANTTMYNISNLTSDTDYYLWIKAVNDFGSSSAAPLNNGFFTTAQAGFGSITVNSNNVQGNNAQITVTVMDSDIDNDTTLGNVNITVTSTADSTGINMTLHETIYTSSVYTGTLICSESASASNAILVHDDGTADGDTISLIYTDATPQAPVKIAEVSYQSIFHNAAVNFAYTSMLLNTNNLETTNITVTVTDPDLNTNHTVTVHITSSSDTNGFDLLLNTTNGSASGIIGFTQSASAEPDIQISGNDTVSAVYTDPVTADRSNNVNVNASLTTTMGTDGVLTIPGASAFNLSGFEANHGSPVAFTLEDSDRDPGADLTVNVATTSDPAGVDIDMSWDSLNSEWDGTVILDSDISNSSGSTLLVASNDTVTFTYTDPYLANGSSGNITAAQTAVIAFSYAPVALDVTESGEGYVQVQFANPDSPDITISETNYGEGGDITWMQVYFSNAAGDETFLARFTTKKTTGTPQYYQGNYGGAFSYNAATQFYTGSNIIVPKGTDLYFYVYADYRPDSILGDVNKYTDPYTITTSGTPIAAPVSMSVTITNDYSFTMNWVPAAAGIPDGYKIYVSEDPANRGFPKTTITNTNTTNYSVTGLMPGTAYYTWVSAFDIASEKYCGSNLVTTTGTTPAPASISTFDCGIVTNLRLGSEAEAVDDNTGTYWWANNQTGAATEAVFIDLGTSQTLTFLKVYWHDSETFFDTYNVYVTDDTNSGNWGSAVAVDQSIIGAGDPGPVVTELGSAAGRYIVIEANNTGQWWRIHEIDVYQ